MEKIDYYNKTADSDLQLSAADKELLIRTIEREFPLKPKPEQIVPDDFIDYCDDVSFSELYDDWKSIPYYELWYERACMTFLLLQGLSRILPAILHTMAKRAYGREISHRLIGAIASKAEKSMIVTKNQYLLMERVSFLPEEDIALHAEDCFDKEDCFGYDLCEQINKARKVLKFFSAYVDLFHLCCRNDLHCAEGKAAARPC